MFDNYSDAIHYLEMSLHIAKKLKKFNYLDSIQICTTLY